MDYQCKKHKLISAYLDKALSVKKSQEVELHLETCIFCQQELRALEIVTTQLRDVEEIELSSSFERKFWQKVKAFEDAQDQSIWQKIFSSGWQPYLASAVSILFFIGVLSLYTFQGNDIEKLTGLDEITIAENIELFQNYEIIEHLELLENWDEISKLEKISG